MTITNIAEKSLNDNTMKFRVNMPFAYIADLSDIHVGNMYHNQKGFDDFINFTLSIPNLYLIIGGDSTESSSVNSASSIYEEYEHGYEQIDEVVRKLQPIKDRILFIRSGNHGYERAKKHGNLPPEWFVARQLDKNFYHGCATVFFNVNKNCYVISTFHNTKKPDKMDWLRSDITFYEHLHKQGYTKDLVAEPNKYTKKWAVREHVSVQAGSFLSWGGYSADKGYRPLKSGTNIVELGGNTRSVNVYDNTDIVKEIERFRRSENIYGKDC